MRVYNNNKYEELKTLRKISFKVGGPLAETYVSQKAKFKEKMKETESIIQEFKTVIKLIALFQVL